jgi:aminoglycoside phosphotransferase family enzyme
MTAKYNFGGISKRIGQYKVRVGQGDLVTRYKQMIKEEHTEIDLIEFDGKLTKEEVCNELLKIERFQQFREVILETLAKKSGAAPAATPKAAKPATTKQATAVKQKPKVVVQKPLDDDLVLEELKQLVA